MIKRNLVFLLFEQMCPKGIADRVNLGLIPSSKAGWHVACAALKPEGGMLHIHSNVTTTEPTTPILQITKEEKESANRTGINDSCEIRNKSNLSERICETEPNLQNVPQNERHLTNKRTNLLGVSQMINVGACCDTADGLSPFVSMRGSDVKGEMSQSEAGTVRSMSEQKKGEDFVRTNQTSGQPLKELGKAAFSYWLKWAEQSQSVIEEIFHNIYKKSWRTEIHHIEHVKSYAPHVDHIVVDLMCRPK